jgi:hypothetical protein
MKKSMVILTVACGWLGLSAGSGPRPVAGQREELPVYGCRRAGREIELTGRMSDPLWRSAAPVSLVAADSGERADRATEVRLLWSPTTLYIGFRCEDDFVWGTRTEPDSDIYREECVEVFVDPSGCGHQYYEINVSPKNVVFDACILNGRTPDRPEAKFIGLTQFHPDGLRTAVSVEGDVDRPGGAKSWTAEYAIPLASLIGAPHFPPRPGDEWRLNLYRIDAPDETARRYYAWNPTGRIDFHRPWRFGILKFEDATLSPDGGR